ncbi:MAG: NFACT family protein [Lachnospiraceae bacterium]|nr:NFACT family protein [Lachnospiraceae bacterium]
MSFDGTTIHELAYELNKELSGGKINKIAQPESEELLLTIKANRINHRLLISSNASLPLIYLTQNRKESPIVAPNFCMVLRKYIGNGLIKSIAQVDFERVIKIEIEHLDELKDVSIKYLYVEIMGKHSNIIFTDGDNKIIDAIKHISYATSSVREVLPGKEYFIPAQENKSNPLTTNLSEFKEKLNKPSKVAKAIYGSYVGISPFIAIAICADCNIDADMSCDALSEDMVNVLYNAFNNYMTKIKSNTFNPYIILENGEPKDYASVPFDTYKDIAKYEDMSTLLEAYYSEKNRITNIKQRSADIRKIIQIHIERNARKLNIQRKQLDDTKKCDKFKLYGELLMTYAQNTPIGEKKITVNNYYNNEDVTITLDPTLDGVDNAKRYYNKYNKCKRTKEALVPQIEETEKSLEHLKAIEASIMLCENEADLKGVKDELIQYGYIKKSFKNKKKSAKSKPLHFVTEDDYHIYVGKNNLQNDDLTFHFATGNDWWFHSKKIHGSHVIAKVKDNEELPDHIFEIAANLAAYYSAARESSKVEIDYIQKKHIKKPNAAVPGFVIYYTNYSMVATPSLDGVTLV